MTALLEKVIDHWYVLLAYYATSTYLFDELTTDDSELHRLLLDVHVDQSWHY